MPKNQLATKNNRENKLKNCLELAKIHALSKDGECLSKEYINSKAKLEWKCNNSKHSSWFASYYSVINRTWCPECGINRNVQENRVKNILNYLFRTDFIKIKPYWNINPETNRLLELDGYCEKLKLAFEYQGEHHFLTSRFNNEEKLAYIKRKDIYKKENCKLNDVKIIVINYIKNGNNFELFIKEINRAKQQKHALNILINMI